MAAGLKQQSTAAAYTTVTRTVAAGKTDALDITGNYVRCVQSSLASFKIGFDGGPPQFFAQGLKIRNAPGQLFSQLTIDNTLGAAPLTYTLAVGTGDVDDSRVSGNTSVSTAIGAAATPSRANVTSGAAVQLDGTAGRQSITVQNMDAAETIYIGKDNTVTTATGYPIGPGGDITIDHSNGPVWAISSTAAGVAVAVLVEA